MTKEFYEAEHYKIVPLANSVADYFLIDKPITEDFFKPVTLERLANAENERFVDVEEHVHPIQHHVFRYPEFFTFWAYCPKSKTFYVAHPPR